MELEIRQTGYATEIAQKLVAEALEDNRARYGSPDATSVDATDFDPPDGGFLVAYANGQPVGCGAWRSWGGADEVAEIKRLYVGAATRRTGLARRIMAALEEDARLNGRKRIILETGTAQPEAIALYEALGYERIEPYGYYKDEPGVRCFGKPL